METVYYAYTSKEAQHTSLQQRAVTVRCRRPTAWWPLHGASPQASPQAPALQPTEVPRCVASVAFPALQIASRFRRAWDMGLAMLLAYAAITVPYRWGGQTCPRFKCTDWQPTRWL